MIGILSFFFFIILFLIKTDSIATFDISIYNFLATNMNDGLTNIFRSITFLGSGASIAGICIIALIITFHLKKRKIGLVIAACVTFNSLFSEGLKMIIQRPRPEILQLATESSFSFPSSHTLASVSLCGILLYFVLKWEGDKSLDHFFNNACPIAYSDWNKQNLSGGSQCKWCVRWSNPCNDITPDWN